MSSTKIGTNFVTAFTTEDETLAIQIRKLIEEADISCQLIRGVVPTAGEGDFAQDLIEIKVTSHEMPTVSRIIDASQSIGFFSALEPLPPASIEAAPFALAPTPVGEGVRVNVAPGEVPGCDPA